MSQMKATARTRVDAAAAHTLNQWPLLLALAVFAAGVVTAGFGPWRVGAVIIAVAVGLAGVLRWVLPSRIAGLLVVRTRAFDVTILLTLAVAIGVLSVVVPATHG